MRIRSIIGTISLFSGLAFFATGGFVLTNALQRNAGDFERIRIADLECTAQLETMGTFVNRGNDVFEIIIDHIEDPRVTMADITAIAAACPTKVITETCVGTTCGANDRPGPMRAVVTLNPKAF